MSSNAKVLLVNRDGKFLLGYRGANARTNPNKWGAFGGGIESEETPEQALIREVKEETGYDLHIFKLLSSWEEGPDDGRNYFLGYIEAELHTLTLTEEEDAQFFTYEEALAAPLTRTLRRMLIYVNEENPGLLREFLEQATRERR